jgi:hypothetical protein
MPEDDLNPVDRLLAIEDLKRLKARYFRFVDTKKWRELQELFAADATVNFPESSLENCPIGTFLEILERYLDGSCSIHHGYMPEITVTSDDSASAIWSMDDRLYFSETRAADGIAAVRGFGHYHETYVRQEGRWLIKTLRLTRLRLERDMAVQVVT